MEEPTRNPYDPLRPAVDPAMFFGREDVFAFIRQRLIGARRPQAVGLIGQRGMGKTSVLLQLANQIEARYLTAYIDLSDVRFNEVGGLLAAMADAARQALEGAGLSTYRLPPIPQDPNIDLWTWFSETYLDVTLSALRRNRRLVFLFDNTSKLLDAIDQHEVPEHFDVTLGQMIARDERMDIIFAVDAEDEQRIEAFMPLSDPLMHKRLTRLDDSSAEALIRVPIAPFYEVQTEAVQAILAMTGGYPYLMHVMNGVLWEHVMARSTPARRGPATLADVNGVLRQATDEADPVLRLIWTRSTANERQALTALTALTTENLGLPVKADEVRSFLLRESDEPLDETSLAAALRRLEYREVLRSPSAGTYMFANGLEHQWLVLNGDAQPVSDVRIPARPSSRRLAIPIMLLLVVSVFAALLLGTLVATQSVTGGASSPTVTLPMDVAATGQIVGITQTFLAQPTITSTSTPSATFTPSGTYTPSSTFTPSMTGTPLPTSTPSDTPPPSATFTPSNTGTPTMTFTASATFTITPTATITNTATITPLPSITPTPPLSITPPPFPTAQIRAPSS